MILNKCVAVILAGGQSSRMGQPKGLLDYFGKYWLLEQLDRLKSAGIKMVCIGLGYNANTYFKAIPFLEKALSEKVNYKGIELQVILNEKPQLGSFSTLKIVLENLLSTTHVLILPIDIPILNTEALKQLKDEDGDIVKPIYKERSGHPIKLSHKVLEKLMLLPDDARLDTFINSYPAKEIKKLLCTDWQIHYNINTPKQWENYKSRVKKYE